MKNLPYLLLFLLALLLICCNRGDKKTKSESETLHAVIDSCLPIADPYVLFYDGTYYGYGTSTKGFEVYTSADLKHWKRKKQLALSPENSYGSAGYWAPEVYYIESLNLFKLFYTVDEHICVATSDNPLGPFVQEQKEPIWEEKSIDTSLFIDDDGTPYLYFVRFTNGNVIWVAEMTSDLNGIKEETLTQCIECTEPWELDMERVTEGPSILKKEGLYYLIYSANHYQSHNYGVGYATANSPYGPWEKYNGNPILQKEASLGLVGTGHGAPFVSEDGSLKYIFHAHNSKTEIHPRTSYIKDLVFTNENKLFIQGEIIAPWVVVSN